MKNIINVVIIIYLGIFINSSLIAACPSADLTGDCQVDIEDLIKLSSEWLNSTCIDPIWCNKADLNHNGLVNLEDFVIISSQWLMIGISEPKNMVFILINDFGVFGHEGFSGKMSKYEITNAQYCEFLNAAIDSGDITIDNNYVYGSNGFNNGSDFIEKMYYNLSGPGSTKDGTINGGYAKIKFINNIFIVDSGFENHPVTYVSWYGAMAFCNYYEYRLPTEWEWEAVADYDGSYIFGCGITINNNIANYYGSIHFYGTTEIGSFGSYGYNMADMSGNLCEWTSSDWSPMAKVLRGGSWLDPDEDYCVISVRYYNDPNSMCSDSGFRVCR